MLDLISCFDLLEKKRTNDILRFTMSSTCRWCLGCAGSQMPQQRNLCRTGWSHHQSSLCPWPINIDKPGPCLIAFVAFPRQIKGLQLNVAGQIMLLHIFVDLVSEEIMNSKTSFIFTWEWSRARPQGRTPWACRGTCDPWTSWKASQWTGSQTPPWFPSLRTKNDQQRIQTQRWFSLTKQQECKFVYSPEKLNRRSYVLNSIAVLLFVDWLSLPNTEYWIRSKSKQQSDDETSRLVYYVCTWHRVWIFYSVVMLLFALYNVQQQSSQKKRCFWKVDCMRWQKMFRVMDHL